MVHPQFISRWWPKAMQDRVHGMEPRIQPMRKKFLRAAFINFALLQLLFLGLFAYLFGSLYQQDSHTHNLNVLYVDYDGGAVGQAVRTAYASLEGHGFPSLQEKPASSYAIEDLRDTTCKAKFWAVLYTSPGASARLETALGGLTASTYDRSDVLTFIWNEARYPAILDSSIATNLQTLSSAARTVYLSNNTISGLATNNPAAVSVFANPWTLKNVNIQPTTQGSRAIYNTLVIILILIQEFFYLGTVNGLYAAFKIYAQLYPHRIIIYRNFISLAYTFAGSLCTAGMIWAFRASWNVNGVQFVLSWMVLWLFAHANFLAFDVFTVWLPVQYVPMALITWIVFNVSSILLPFELSPAFYRWAYAMPAHEVYVTLTDIWSGGCNPQLRYTLPILFSLELVGLIGSALGVYRRCHFAILGKQAEEKALQEKVSAAVAFERGKVEGRRGTLADLEQAKTATAAAAAGVEQKVSQSPSSELSDTEPKAEADLEADAAEDRAELASVIRSENDQIRREQTRASRACNFGPSFDLAYQDN